MSVFWNIIETFSIVITAACVTFTIFFIIQTLYPQCNVVPEAHTKIRRAKQRRTLSTNRVTFAENHEETPSQAFESRPKCIVKSILKRSAPTILAETASVVSKPSLSVSPGESCAPDTCTRRPSFSTYSIEVIEHTEVVSYNIAPSDGPIVSLAPVVRQIGKGLPRRLSGFEPSLTLSSDAKLYGPDLLKYLPSKAAIQKATRKSFRRMSKTITRPKSLRSQSSHSSMK